MPERIIKVAVTGLGVSRGYIPFYRDAPEAKVVLVHDVNAARAQEVAKEFDVPRWTADYADVLSSDADMVDVSTPNQFHAEQTVAALVAEKHVLVQKPMARNVAECRRMIDAAVRAGKTLGVMMTWLNNDWARDIRRAIAEGCFGKIASVRTRNAHREPYLQKDMNHWRARVENVGGGAFIQLGVHSLNLALWLVQQDVVSVVASARNLHCAHSMEGEDVISAIAELGSGALLTMESGYSSTGRSLEIYGTEGRFVMTEGQVFIEMARDFEGEFIKYKRATAGSSVWPESSAPNVLNRPMSLRAGHTDPGRNQNRAFVRAILEGRAPDVPGEVGLRDVAIIQAIYRSAKEGRRVAVKEMLEEH